MLENEVMQLIQYAPDHRQVYERPLLDRAAVHQQVLHPRPAAGEFLRALLRRAGLHDFHRLLAQHPAANSDISTWDDYVRKGVFAPLEAVRAITGADKVNTLGFCVGGTLLATRARSDGARRTMTSVCSLTLLASMLDFSETGDISVFIDREFVERSRAGISGERA